MRKTPTDQSIIDLVAIYQPVVCACCRFHHVPADRVEDITHDAFLAAYTNLSRYNGQGTMSAWLWRIARHKIIDQMKRESTRHRFEQKPDCTSPSVETTEPAALAQTRELHDALHEVVEMLPGVWTEVVTLHYWYQQSARQIAERMRIKPSTVSVILHRSRKRLRKDLESMLVPPHTALAAAS